MRIIETTYRWGGTLVKRQSTTRIILHHAAAKTCTAQQIHSWHLANGWAGIGYHFFVRKDGSIYRGRPEDVLGAHAGSNNYDSIGVCFEGNFMSEQMPAVQRQAGAELVAYLKQKYGISKVQKHSDVNATGCPGTHFPFDAIAYGGEPESDVQAVELNMKVRMLRRGMQGADVKTLQAALIAYGYSCGAAGADGDFGGGTEAALRKFQTKYGLGADGIAGRGTWGKLLGE